MKGSEYPALYQSASDAARDGQTAYKQLVRADLSTIVVGAMLAALALLVPSAYAAAFAAVAAIVLLVSTVAAFVSQLRRDDTQWFDARGRGGG